ncbi:rRNA maturation RNase YbeY [Salipiger marinus]|uniref:Endoribonuclease YbeY n=1 Tax=Salipiger marinus TaxID=555512 RepID=A0A1G8LHL3_9RHOB|nr:MULTISPECIES: rRNA maturation RNase YbeY [Salipiger]MCD1619857.1 rRNA maturation RNase YbeY [Salipiger manganoxidans]MEB3418469.1 rRNA maturation RNase YbeY [Salipiger manganoxidans]SDI55143.1 probable rRNA maturation factor [Salipiger marinus]
MPDLTDTLIEDDRWQQAGIAPLAETAARATLTHLGLDPDGFEIAVLACDDARIAELNAEFRGKPVPTNVLSWPSEERGAEEDGAAPDLPEAEDGPFATELGDLAIAYETCAREAEAAEKRLSDHVTHLVVHGTLHLLGYDHERDADATLMEGLETEILGNLGIADPYVSDGGG